MDKFFFCWPSVCKSQRAKNSTSKIISLIKSAKSLILSENISLIKSAKITRV